MLLHKAELNDNDTLKRDLMFFHSSLLETQLTLLHSAAGKEEEEVEVFHLELSP